MTKKVFFTMSLVLAIVFSAVLSGEGFADSHEKAKDAMKKGGEMMKEEMVDKMMSPTSATPAADLRKTLNLLVAEHVWLGAAATNAALNGNQKEFEGAAAALDENSKALAAANGSVYGQEAEEAFLPLWRKHIGFIVDYTKAVGAGDEAKAEKAVNDLLGYAADFAAFINSASPSLPVDAVEGLVKEHAVTFKAVIDAQAAGNDAEAFINLRKAVAHMQKIADAHAEAIVQQFPEKFAAK